MWDQEGEITNADMVDETPQDPVERPTQALEKYNTEKKELDKKYNSSRHCIVGQRFGSYMTTKPNTSSTST